MFAQLVLAKILRSRARGQRAARLVPRGLGDECLTSGREGAQTRAARYGATVVDAVTLVRRAGVERHAQTRWPLLRIRSALYLDGARERFSSGLEHDESAGRRAAVGHDDADATLQAPGQDGVIAIHRCAALRCGRARGPTTPRDRRLEHCMVLWRQLQRINQSLDGVAMRRQVQPTFEVADGARAYACPLREGLLSQPSGKPVFLE